jgi:hypothetical protein
MSTNKPRLAIISDLWGTRGAEWVDYYLQSLEPTYDVAFYDSCMLAGFDCTNLQEEEIHAKMVAGGIEAAAAKLLEQEKGPVDILAFSVGGTIAWKAMLLGITVGSAYLVSSTRLRYETSKPEAKIYLTYGEADEYRPSEEWFEKLGLEHILIKHEGHTLYREESNARRICEQIKGKQALQV